MTNAPRLGLMATVFLATLCGGGPSFSQAHYTPGPAAIAVVEHLPPYRADTQVSGHIRLWGHGSFKRDFMGGLVKGWIKDFQKQQPGVTFDYQMYGTASAIGALYTDAGDIAILGEEISPAAVRAFTRAKGYAPTGVEIATGCLDVNFYDYAHMIFVHKDNPVRKLTLAQLDAIFGAENKRSGHAIRTWGELGVKGEMAKQPIQPYGWKTDVDFALFFRERVMEDSHRWNSAIVELEHAKRPDGTQYDHGQRILDALSKDPYGIAISNIRYQTPDVRALDLAWSKDVPAVAATSETLIAQTYPLTRIIPAYIDQPLGKPMEPALREFLKFILSRDGQTALIEQSGYLPLGPEARAKEVEKLK